MSVSIVSNSGSGRFEKGVPSSFSYSEDVTSLEPANLTGGAGQVNVSGPAIFKDKDGNTHPNSALLINNEVTLTDTEQGSVAFQVRQVSVGEHSASIIGNTLMWRLNVEKTAPPHGGAGATLMTAIITYCDLVGITPTWTEDFALELDAMPVNFIGWKGNVWEHLKMLCAAVSLSETDNVGIEMVIELDQLVFRKAKNRNLIFQKSPSSSSLEINSFDAAKKVSIQNYNTVYGLDRVVQEQNIQGTLFATNENVSITDSMQVEAGQRLVKRFAINASLESVNQPVCVAAITELPYTGTQGEYVVVGSDDLPIDPDQWAAEGGSLTVSLTENPNEIEIVMIAPASVTMPTSADPLTEVTPAPYKIGIESSGEADYPALWIVGTGVFFEKTENFFYTGASDVYTSQDTASSIDNPFITNQRDMAMRGVAAAQAICGPSIVLSQTRHSEVSFAETVGSIIEHGSNKFRITSVSYGPGSASMVAAPCAMMSDFDAKWTGKTFADFTSIALDPDLYPDDNLRFNEFTVIPLMESA